MVPPFFLSDISSASGEISPLFPARASPARSLRSSRLLRFAKGKSPARCARAPFVGRKRLGGVMRMLRREAVLGFWVLL